MDLRARRFVSNRGSVPDLYFTHQYYKQPRIYFLDDTRALVGFTPAIPTTYRLYAAPMMVYELNFIEHAIQPIIGNDKATEYPGYVTDIRPGGFEYIYLPYDRIEPKTSPWEIVVVDSQSSTEKRYAIPKEYKDVGMATFHPTNPDEIGFVAAYRSKDPERGGIFSLNTKTGEITKIDWTDNGYYWLNGWKEGKWDYELRNRKNN